MKGDRCDIQRHVDRTGNACLYSILRSSDKKGRNSYGESV